MYVSIFVLNTISSSSLYQVLFYFLQENDGNALLFFKKKYIFFIIIMPQENDGNALCTNRGGSVLVYKKAVSGIEHSRHSPGENKIVLCTKKKKKYYLVLKLSTKHSPILLVRKK